MLKITAELESVAKNLTVGYGRNSYKAVGERDVIDAVKPLEVKYGVYSYPCHREIIDSQVFETTRDDGKTVTTFFSRIQTVYRFVNIDDPVDFLDITSFAEGIDSQDKGSGKAMTYADKYALLKAYKISTGDDPDQEASEPWRYTKKAETKEPTDDQKAALRKACDDLGLNLTTVLEKAGFKKGMAFDMSLYNKALEIIKQLAEQQ